MRIMEMCPDERPREKMRQKGARALSNAELLAILISSGTGGKNVLELAQEVMLSCGGRLALLATMPLEILERQKGVGKVKAITIAAALELGRRSFEELSIMDKRSITSPAMVYQIMIPHLKNIDHEECWIIMMNRSHYVIGKEMISSGSMENTSLDTKKILRRAIEKQCSYVILVHNHPSGNPRPGEADIYQTERLKRTLRAVEISLIDHIIVAEDSYFSFSEDQVCKIK